MSQTKNDARLDDAQLPPHAPEHERGLLACCMLGKTDIVKGIADRIGELEVWYDVRHMHIWRAICAMDAEQRVAIDVVSLSQRLKDFGRLGEAGGVAYVACLPDNTPSAENWPYYLDTVMEKYVARQAIAHASRTIATLRDTEGALPNVIAQAIDGFTKLDELKNASSDTPQRIKLTNDFESQLWELWFGASAGEPGVKLPFGFPWRVRLGELTLVLGEKGKGKSTFLSFVMLHMMRHGMKSFIASMETRPEVTLKILMSQLLGRTRMEQTDENLRELNKGVAWLQSRCVIYDFLGAVDYRVLLHAMAHAVTKLNCKFFLIDSLMRLGIADDDYAGQGRCALTLANFAAQHNVHVILVNHLNKSEGHSRARSRGSQQVVDNSHNVLNVERNEEKWGRIDNWEDEKNRGIISAEELALKTADLRTEWDAKIFLYNQRWPGSRQNGSKMLWFNRDALQYAEHSESESIDFLSRWSRYHLAAEKLDDEEQIELLNPQLSHEPQQPN